MASVTSAFGLRGPRFATPADRRVIDAVETGLERMEVLLDEHLRIADPVADAVARYLNEAGGKRARPLLLLLAAHLGRGIDDEVLAPDEEPQDWEVPAEEEPTGMPPPIILPKVVKSGVTP